MRAPVSLSCQQTLHAALLLCRRCLSSLRCQVWHTAKGKALSARARRESARCTDGITTEQQQGVNITGLSAWGLCAAGARGSPRG